MYTSSEMDFFQTKQKKQKTKNKKTGYVRVHNFVLGGASTCTFLQ